jgi:hypothetical protein
MSSRQKQIAFALGCGIVLGFALTLSPLGVLTVVCAAGVVACAGLELPRDERRLLAGVLIAALAARLAVIFALSVASIPIHDDQNAGILFGDEAYSLGRALRTRNLAMGFPASKYDYMVVFDSYASTRYMSFLSWLQLTFGPSPYAVRALNGVLFVAGAAVLFRLARRGFGLAPAIGALCLLVFMPSLFLWSISLLKESAYFLLTAGAIGATVLFVRLSTWRARATVLALLAVCLALLADMRPGAVVLTAGGLAIGLFIYWTGRTVRRTAIVAAAAVAATVAVLWTPAASARVLDALTTTAKQHTGHAFTVGHSYKTLDAKFYNTVETPSTSTLKLTAPEAARYVARSAIGFLTVPFPWQIATRSEMVFMPEQLVWYALVLFACAGLAVSWRRDPLLASLLLGYVLPMSAVLALTNGNVGTLVRLRSLVTPFVMWIGAVGAVAALQRAVERGAVR